MAFIPSQIHRYARDGNASGIADALANEIDVDAIDRQTNRTPLMEAVQSKDARTDVIQLLIKNPPLALHPTWGASMPFGCC